MARTRWGSDATTHRELPSFERDFVNSGPVQRILPTAIKMPIILHPPEIAFA